MTFIYVLRFCTEQKLTLLQFTLLFSKLHFKDYNNYRKVNSFNDKFITKNLVEDLIDKGFIVSEANGQYSLSEKTLQIFVSKEEAMEQFLEAYPLVSFESRLTVDELAAHYINNIEYSRKEHQQVMKDLAYAIEINYELKNVETFIIEKKWLNLRIKRLYNGNVRKEQ